MLAVGHLDQRIHEVSLAGLFLHEPDLVKALPADTTAQVSVELDEGEIIVSGHITENGRKGSGKFWTSRYIPVGLRKGISCGSYTVY